MSAIFKRELRAYFTGPIGYIFIAIFLFLANGSFCLDSLTQYKSDISAVFENMVLIFIILIPLMTMRLWSEEKRQKTDQLLLTAPVSTTGVVLGKFFAALCVVLIALVLTLVYPILVSWKGTLDTSKTIGNYIGVILVAASYISISLFISSLTKSQILSAIGSILILVVFYIMHVLVYSGVTTSPIIAAILSFFAMSARFVNLSRGILALSDILYFISLTVIFIFLTSRVIEKQRWS